MRSVPLRVSFPGPLLRLACLGGGGPVPVPPYLAWGCGGGGRAPRGGGAFYCCEGRLGSGAPPPSTARPLGGLLGSSIPVLWARACGCGGPSLSPRPARPVGAARRGAGPWRSCAGGRAGGEGGMRRTPRLCGRGGACRAGGCSASFRPSAFPGQATMRVSLASFCPWGAWPPITLRFVLARLLWARSVRRPGALARARLFSAAPVGAGGWGGGAGRALAPLSGGGGDQPPLPREPVAGAPAACGWGGGVAPRPPCLPSGWRLRYSILSPLASTAHSPPACACGRSRGAAPGWGGVRGGPWTAPPGAPADLNPPSALPEWAVVTRGSCGARPPYCSGARVAPAGWCGLALRPRPPREQVQPHPPPPASRSLLGGGGVPSAPGGPRAAPVASKLGGVQGGGVRGAAAPPLRPVGRQPAFCCPRRPPPGEYLRRGGCRAAAGVGRGPVGRRRVSAAGRGGGGGGGTPPPWFALPSSPGRPLIRPLCLRRPGRRRSAVGRQQAGRVGACSGRGAPAPRVQWPLREGCGAAVSSVCRRPLLGLSGRGGGSGGGPLVPWRRLLTAEGGAAWRPRPRRPAIGWGVAPFPRPPLPRAGPSCRPSLGPLIPPAVVARRWAARGGREG